MEFTYGNEKKKDERKKQQKAVAVQYEAGSPAPAIVAKGAGVVAERIIEKAKETDVPVYRNEEFVEELSRIDLGDNIPPELYEVVAQVLIFVSDLDKMQGYRNAYEKR